MKKTTSKAEHILSQLSILGMFLTAFILGGITVHMDIPPGSFLKQAMAGGQAYYTKLRYGTIDYNIYLWRDVRFPEDGVTVYNREKAYDGLTLVTSGDFSGAQLLDMDGKVVHEWRASFKKAFPVAPHVKGHVREEWVYWRKAWLFPNGDVIAVYEMSGDTPYGYGLAKLDKDSNVIWNYPERVHHDVWVEEDGTIYTLAHMILNRHPADLWFIGVPYIEDFIVVLSPEGKEINRISITEAIFRSDYVNEVIKLQRNYQYAGDFSHINTVRIIPESLDGKLPFLKKGLLLTASRHMNYVGLIDIKEKKFVWMQTGVWHLEHDPEFTEKGTLFLFDNYGDHLRTRHSRVIEYDPLSMTILWRYDGPKDRPIFSDIRGSKQLLPNGNILITESDGGRLLEVTRDKELVWEYVNPAKEMKGKKKKIAVLCAAKRFAREELDFLDGKQTAMGSEAIGQDSKSGPDKTP